MTIGLIHREFREKRDLNAAPGKLDVFLMKLAMEEIPEEGLHFMAVMKVFARTMQEYGISTSSDEILNLAEQLGILIRVGDKVDFALEEYRNYFMMKAIDCDL